MREQWAPVSLALLISSVTAAAFLHALNLASRLVQTSDSVQSLVAGHAILKGNVLLTGWRFPIDDYYVTDTLPYAALEWLAGPERYLLVLAPALTYALLVFTALLASALSSQPFLHRITGVVIVTFLLVCPSWTGSWDPLLFTGFHVSATLLAIVALSLCAVVAAREHAPQISPVLLFVAAALVTVTGVTVASDPFSLVFAFGPAGVVLMVDASRKEHGKPIALVLLISGVATGLLLPAVVACVGGGFATENNVAVGFASDPSQSIRSVVASISGFLIYFGADVFEPRGGAGLFLGIRVLAAMIVAAAVIDTVLHLVGGRQAPLFDRLLCAGILSVLTACALSAKFAREVTPESMWSGSGSIRYLVPAVFLAATVAGRRIPLLIEALPAKIARNGMRGLFAILALIATIAGDWPSRVTNSRPAWINDNAPLAVAQWLERRGLKQGIGEYWSANLITALSNEAVQVRSVGPFGGRLVPYVWVSNVRSYSQSPQFAVWEEPNQSQIRLEDVRATRAVCALATVQSYRIALFRDAGDPNRCAGVH